MNKNLLILFLLLLFLVDANSQSDFRKGYIIRLTNDTLFGLIEYKGISASSKKCLYKPEAGSESIEFTPDEIKAYRFIDSKYYISKILNPGESPLFLEYLIDGIVDIYYYRDERGEHYLADKGDEKFYELKNEEKKFVVNNTSYYKESKEYIGTLKFVFSESLRVGKKVESITLNHKSLIDLANEYHNEICTDKKCIIFEKKLPRFITSFGPLVGVNVTSMTTKDKYVGSMYYFLKSDFDVSMTPSIGFFIKVNLPYVNERIHFQYQAEYTTLTSRTVNLYIEPVLNMNYVNDIKFTQSILANTALIRYEFPKGLFRPSLHAGLFYNYYFKTDYLRKIEITSSTGDRISLEEIKETPFAKSDYGLCLGVGVIKKIGKRNLFVDLTYQHGLGFLQYLSTDYLLLQLGFQLGK